LGRGLNVSLDCTRALTGFFPSESFKEWGTAGEGGRGAASGGGETGHGAVAGYFGQTRTVPGTR
jgi:hypothetical protein